MIVLRCSVQGEDIGEHIEGKCHLCTLLSTCRSLVCHDALLLLLQP